MNIQRNLEICLDELNSGTATPQLVRRTQQIIDYAIAKRCCVQPFGHENSEAEPLGSAQIAQKQELEDAISSTSQALSRAKREVQR